ncbi:hypothetical protein [Halomonas heilongjiangensis]|uniref:hypothetical protein n=1 Tax=Halomonas heilongjiangensis TaxID=1387883 RepID=UPI0011AEE122|nr:hypothetical protein [Halomonas heilongjiangensis]
MSNTNDFEIKNGNVLPFGPDDLGITEKIATYTADLGLTSADIDKINRPWDMYATAMSKQIRGEEDWSGLQLLTIPKAAQWNDPQYGVHYALEDIGNTIPKWSPYWESSSRKFHENYGFILNSIKLELPNAEEQRNAEDAAQAWVSALKDYEDAFLESAYDWIEFNNIQEGLPEHRRITYDTWYARYGAPRLTKYKDRVTFAAATYQVYFNKARGADARLAQLITEFRNDAYYITTETPSGLRIPHPSYDITPDLQDFIDSSQEMIRNNPNKPPAMTLSFNHSSGYRNTTTTRMGGSASWGGFIRINVGGAWESKQIDSFSKNFSCKVSFQNVEQFSVKPGPWYSALALQIFAGGPWLDNSYLDRWLKKGNSLFGERGLLNLRQKTVIVAYQPSISISLSSREYHYFKKVVKGGGGISIGPFRFGGRGSTTTENINWNDATSMFTAVDTSGSPKIVAMLDEIMPPGE